MLNREVESPVTAARLISKSSWDSWSEGSLSTDQGSATYTILIPDGPEAELILLQKSPIKAFLFVTLSLLTVGVLPLFSRWFPTLLVKLIYVSGVEIKRADSCLIRNEYDEQEIVELQKLKFDWNRRGRLVFFEYQGTRFVYSERNKDFYTFDDSGWEFEAKLETDIQNGISLFEAEYRKSLFGANETLVPEKTWFEILVEEVLHPFFLFQILSTILWTLDNYIFYAMCILLISIVSVIISLFDTKKNIEKMKSMTKFDFPVSVLRDGSWSNVVSTEIVPGDIVKLDDSVQLIPCDGYLLFGDLIVDESMLTGESIPITKKATFRGHSGSVVQAEGKTGPIDPGNLFGLLENQKARNFLFSGTRIVQSKNLRRRQPVCMIASKTGFNTVKGRLIRAIIFPPPNRFKFYLDSFKFVGVLSVLALCGFVYTAWNFTRLHARISEILFHGFDLVTAVVPPALPATMTIGINFAVSRLRKKKIICVSPQRVNMCGKISVVCFDKTGTLTEDSLGIHGIVISDPDGSLKDFSCIEEAASSSSPHALLMEYLLACCHSLRQIQAAVLGDPLEVEMFNFSKWTLIEEQLDFATGSVSEDEFERKSHHDNIEISIPILSPQSSKHLLELHPFCSEERKQKPRPVRILYRFEFSSESRRMSVVGLVGDEAFLFTKGAPEVLKNLFVSVPSDFTETLKAYTHKGYRVIGCGYKKLGRACELGHIDDNSRAEFEKDLEYCGLIIFENKLKAETTGAIQILRQAHLRVLMATGDNLLTAVFVGRECGIIHSESVVYYQMEEYEHVLDSRWALAPGGKSEDYEPELSFKELMKNLSHEVSLAVSGTFLDEARETLNNDMFETLLRKTQIYGRLSPQTKTNLVEELRRQGESVLMCGDGANDCGALKAADVGISLSDLEASIAAPFTSLISNISCVPKLLCEGRCALVTSFSCFKFMALYSLTQFSTVLMLYSYLGNLGDLQYLYIDLILALPLAIFMARTKAEDKLSRKTPTSDLLSIRVLLSLFGQVGLQLAFQVFIFLNVRAQSWYQKPAAEPGLEIISSYENAVLFRFSIFVYLFLSWILSIGRPFRRPLLTNVPFTISALILGGCCATLLFLSHPWILDTFELKRVPWNYRVFLSLMIGVYLVGAYMFEKVVECL